MRSRGWGGKSLICQTSTAFLLINMIKTGRSCAVWSLPWSSWRVASRWCEFFPLVGCVGEVCTCNFATSTAPERLFYTAGNVTSPHSSYSEGDHCPLRFSGLRAAHTFFWVIPQRFAPYFTVHSVGCLLPTPSSEWLLKNLTLFDLVSEWFLKARTLFHRSFSEMQLV